MWARGQAGGADRSQSQSQAGRTAWASNRSCTPVPGRAGVWECCLFPLGIRELEGNENFPEQPAVLAER